MKVEIIKDYINVDKMADSVFDILKDARDDFKDGEIDGFLDDNYDDDYLHERALEQAIEWNDDMKKYLHMKDHRILEISTTSNTTIRTTSTESTSMTLRL